MKSTTATVQDNINFDMAAAEAVLHGPFVDDILAASKLNNARTCKCTSPSVSMIDETLQVIALSYV